MTTSDDGLQSMFIRVQQRLMDAAAVESYHENGGTEQGRLLGVRRLVGALQDGASARM